MSQVQGLCLCGVGVWHIPGRWGCSPIWKLSEIPTIEIFMEASSHRPNRLLTPFLVSLTSLENGG